MTTAPDLSKLVRGFEDAVKGILWKDDSQVTAITASKAYAALHESSRAMVTTEIEPLIQPAVEKPRKLLAASLGF